MARFTKLFTLAAALLGFLPIHAQDFNPEKDIKATWRNGAVILNVPSVAHASDIVVFLKPGTPGKLNFGPLPPPSGADALGAPYWSGTIKIPVKGEGLKDTVPLVVSYLSCMEGEGGQCFPAVDKVLRIKAKDIPSDPSPSAESDAAAVTVPLDSAPAEKTQSEIASGPLVAAAPTNEDAISPAPSVSVAPDSSVEKPPKKNDGLIKILILFFLGGIGASLTPCVLPMIPITMAVIGARNASKLRGLLLGLVLTEGMALTYTVLGVIAALTGSVFGQFAQQPGFLIPVSIIFAIFAISLFGAFEIRLPESWTEKLQSSGPRKGFLGAFATGLILGPISAPCVGPLIGTAIVEIGQNGHVFEGALKMFVFAQGMGVLFIIGGTAVSALPKGGDWMTRFKQTLGIIVLAFAAWNIRLIVPEWANYFMWAIVTLLTAGVFGAFEVAAGLMGHVRKGFALISLAIAVLLGVRATELYLDVPLLPRGGNVAADDSGGGHDNWIEHDYEAAVAKAKAEGKMVLVDTFTDWCAQCKELDEKTWPDPTVVDWIRNNAIAVRIDTEKVRPDLAKSLGVFAYPTIILMTADGKELRRLNGFHKPEKMLEWLKG
ncbi:MAG: thioredoxin family protein [Holophagales bacterium]|jgi:thiol:disulfide interchange protein DsbD|nr:thioredoxin family protein [Holophagales bacterium]